MQRRGLSSGLVAEDGVRVSGDEFLSRHKPQDLTLLGKCPLPAAETLSGRGFMGWAFDD